MRGVFTGVLRGGVLDQTFIDMLSDRLQGRPDRVLVAIARAMNPKIYQLMPDVALGASREFVRLLREQGYEIVEATDESDKS
jgi:hypothetical protein